MMLFRSAQKSDLAAIHKLAEHAGSGMTTLPKDKNILAKRLEWSCDSFKKKLTQPENEYYFFVLEDPATKALVGTSGIESITGSESPFYSYKLSKRTRICHSLTIRSDYEVLSLVNDNQGCSEICTLFLEPKFRQGNNGLLLSRARFLFMAQYAKRFSTRVIAEMRGISNESGRSPFWDHVGQHFFHMPFIEADRLTLATNKQFIADLMPRNPIYVKLLANEAQEVIAKPHQSTLPAMKMLLREGFRHNGYVDIFDAGPTLEAPFNEIKTISSSRLMTVKNISDEVGGQQFLVANTHLDFRATVCQSIFNEQQASCILSKKAADLLKIKSGDSVRAAPLRTQALTFLEPQDDKN